ncbi:hypothetical protein ACWEKM_04945 [Streptomyces sp. NPDC004752]
MIGSLSLSASLPLGSILGTAPRGSHLDHEVEFGYVARNTRYFPGAGAE